MSTFQWNKVKYLVILLITSVNLGHRIVFIPEICIVPEGNSDGVVSSVARCPDFHGTSLFSTSEAHEDVSKIF